MAGKQKIESGVRSRAVWELQTSDRLSQSSNDEKRQAGRNLGGGGNTVVLLSVISLMHPY